MVFQGFPPQNSLQLIFWIIGYIEKHNNNISLILIHWMCSSSISSYNLKRFQQNINKPFQPNMKYNVFQRTKNLHVFNLSRWIIFETRSSQHRIHRWPKPLKHSNVYILRFIYGHFMLEKIEDDIALPTVNGWLTYHLGSLDYWNISSVLWTRYLLLQWEKKIIYKGYGYIRRFRFWQSFLKMK